MCTASSKYYCCGLGTIDAVAVTSAAIVVLGIAFACSGAVVVVGFLVPLHLFDVLILGRVPRHLFVESITTLMFCMLHHGYQAVSNAATLHLWSYRQGDAVQASITCTEQHHVESKLAVQPGIGPDPNWFLNNLICATLHETFASTSMIIA
ncbi:hypothetical protein QVD17_17769 [Tagetes erecta]|uniref:Uncharacterized protein n=1 Tax=Tagetes erecta TaxID=13708 RepID=A0AAD8P1R0_TARER|nr:hypothetical protein QVD17_17769 [Tagetes erecta]